MHLLFNLPEIVEIFLLRRQSLDYLSYDNALYNILTVNHLWHELVIKKLYKDVTLRPRTFIPFVNAVKRKKDEINSYKYGGRVVCIRFFDLEESVTNEQINTITEGCPKISHIIIKDCPGITQSNLSVMISSYHNILHTVMVSLVKFLSEKFLRPSHHVPIWRH